MVPDASGVPDLAYAAAMLILFDVDGTLLLSSRQGARAMQEAGKRVVGEHFTLEGVEFAGRLDPLIWADGMRRSGAVADAKAHQAFREAYGAALARRLEPAGVAYALPGVPELLDALDRRPHTTLGLLTGNYPETGAIKMRAAGLDPERFAVPVWGIDGPDRRSLLPVGLARYEALHGYALGRERVVVVGDTPHDIDCAHANGCIALAVATGPSYAGPELASHDPELLLDDLTDTTRILRWLDALPQREAGPA